MTLSKREKILLKIALIIIVSFSLIFLVIIPLWTNYQKLNQNLKTEKVLLKKNKLILERGQKYNNKLIELKGELKATESLFYHNKVADTRLELLNVIDEHLKNSNLDIKNKDIFIDKNIGHGLTTIIYRLNLKGQYNDVLIFLNKINKSEKLLITNYLDIRANKRTEEISVNLKIKAFNYSEGDKSEGE